MEAYRLAGCNGPAPRVLPSEIPKDLPSDLRPYRPRMICSRATEDQAESDEVRRHMCSKFARHLTKQY